jgi:feruloyl esterase
MTGCGTSSPRTHNSNWTTITPEAYQALWDRSFEQYGIVIGTDNPDLSAFRDRGGKTIVWHGLADQLITAEGTIDYYTACSSGWAAQRQTSDFVRLFLAPGRCALRWRSGTAAHRRPGCAGVVGEEGKAPETLTCDSSRLNRRW